MVYYMQSLWCRTMTTRILPDSCLYAIADTLRGRRAHPPWPEPERSPVRSSLLHDFFPATNPKKSLYTVLSGAPLHAHNCMQLELAPGVQHVFMFFM